MKKRLLWLMVAVCALLMLGSGSVFAAEVISSTDGSSRSVIAEEENAVSLSESWELSDSQKDLVYAAVGLPEDFSGMINQTYYENQSSYVYVDIYYGQTIVASAVMNRFNNAINVTKYYTSAVFRMNDATVGQWYYNAVKFVYDNGLMQGTDLTHFSPNVVTSRGMLATILYRIEGEPAVTGNNIFTDVKSSDYYCRAVTWASQKGIVNGYGNGKFGPNDSITREQMVTMLYRYVGGYPVSDNSIYNYSDWNRISSYALNAMRWGQYYGLINGVGNNRLDPQGNATRAQMATILSRFVGE